MADALTQAPADRRYSKEHEWIVQNGDGTALIGITDYAANQLGSVVFLVLPEPGAAFGGGAKFGEIESVKSVSDLFVPVACQVIEVNTALLDDPEVVNNSPFADGWMLRVRLTDAGDVDVLLTSAAYSEFLATL